MDPWQRYQAKKAQIVNQFNENRTAQESVSLGKDTSNLFRKHEQGKRKLNVRELNQVIQVNPDSLIADVEGMTTYEELVNETLKYDCMPTVVPELKSITIGGALTGVGIESSSFRYGLVHDTVTEFDVLTGNGEVVTARPDNEHRDLYYAFPNSYGTLGYALRVQVQLIKIKPYVKLTHIKFTNAKDYYAKLKAVCLDNHVQGPIAFVDGTSFTENEIYLTLGEFVDEAPSLSNYKYLNIYYRSIQCKQTDYLTTLDYIWRWDPDWFWCSKAFLMQNKLMRLLFGKWCLRSTVYWKIRAIVENHAWLHNFYTNISGPGESVIQDVLIPIENAPEFFDFFHKEIKIKPLWNCPMLGCHEHAEFTLFKTDPKQLYVNFGFWAIVPITKDTPDGYYNRKIEEKVMALGGVKSLYSDVYFSKDTFWQVYNRQAYFTLKEKYDGTNFLKDLYTKCAHID